MIKIKDILFITQFTQLPGEQGNGRFKYILDIMDNSHANIELITTNFSHRSKKKRVFSNRSMKNKNYKITLIDEPGYNKNVTLKRFYSHYILAKNIKKYLKTRKKPDIIYCSVPSLDVAKVAAKYAEKNKIKFIIDIQDLWPEAFKMVFNAPIISDILFYPMKRQADYIYSVADEIISVSETYGDRALAVNNNCNNSHTVFLGTDLEFFDKMAEKNLIRKPKDEVWLAYIGTLGHSYDIKSVIDALEILEKQGVRNIKFIVMGDGPLENDFKEYALDKSIDVQFMGRLKYDKMIGYLKSCDIAINPIKKGSAGSIINKVGDYAAAGLPVINTQECQEYRSLVKNYKIGFNCYNGDPRDLSKKLLKLYRNRTLIRKMGENNRRLAEERFDRKKTYKQIVNIIES